MDQLFTLLVVCFMAFFLGFLLARNTWLSFEGRQMRHDMRVIINLKHELERHVCLYNAEKKRSAKLLGSLRCANRIIRNTKGWGNSILRDPTLMAAHQLRQAIYQPIPGSKCWQCDKPATTRLGDTMYCNDHVNGEVAR